MNSSASTLTLSGDPDAILASAVKWSQFSTAASAAADDIRAIDSGDFVGDEADLYRERLNRDLPPHLLASSDAWAIVAAALRAYTATLEGLRSRMSTLNSAAADQQVRVHAADDAVADARTADARHRSALEAQAAVAMPGQSPPPETYQGQTVGASAQLATANAALQSTVDAANQLHVEHSRAVDHCVDAIQQASSLRFVEPPGLWGRLVGSVTGWIKDHASVLQALSGVLKQISGIAGLLAMIPVLAPIMGPIAVASGGGALLIDTTVMAVTGQGSYVDIALDAAGLIPGGRTAAAAMRGTRAARDATVAVSTVSRDVRAVRSTGSDALAVRTVGSDAPGAGRAASVTGSDAAGVQRVGTRAGDSATSAADHRTPVDNRACETDPIDVVTGDMVMVQTDLVLPGALPLVLRRVHLSSYRWGGRFGARWASTLDQRVETGRDGGACFVAEDGSVLFYPNAAMVSAGTAVLPTEGVKRWPLRRLVDGGWTVEDPVLGVTRRFAPVDGEGRAVIVEITDRRGNAIRFDYDDGFVVAVRHSGGYVVEVQSAGGFVTLISVLNGLASTPVVSFAYDESTNLVRVGDGVGADALVLDHDEAGRMVGWTDRNGIWYRYEYDHKGRCIRTSGRDRVLSYGFSYLPGRTLVTDSLGAVSSYEFNDARQVVRHRDAAGQLTASTWDRFDRLLLRTDPLGRSTQFEYHDGWLAAVIYPDGRRESWQRNDLGLPTTIVDTAGAVWSQRYDAWGDLESTTDPLGNTIWSRRSRGVVTTCDAVGGVTTVRNNDAGLPVDVQDPTGGRTRYEYDGFGRLVSRVDPAGGCTTVGWSGGGKPLYRIGPDGAREEWTWDGEGNITGHVDAVGARTVIENGLFDLPVSRTDPDGGCFQFGYDTELRLTSVQNAAGLRWTYRYDALGRLVGEIDFNGRTQQYEYDAAGRLVGMQDRLGQLTSLAYDAAGNACERVTVDGSTRLTYDTARRLVSVTAPGAVVTFDRDRLGRIVRETVNGRSVEFEIDACGRRQSRSTPTGRCSAWSFDAGGKPAALRTGDGDVRFTFDVAGREINRLFSAGGVLSQRFDAAHRLIGQSMGAGAPEAIRATSRRFDYRADGTLACIQDAVHDSHRTFDLDPSGRVTGVQAAGWRESYAYDRWGRISSTAVSPVGGGAVGGGAVGALEVDGAISAPAGSALTPVDNGREYTGMLLTRAGRISYLHDRAGRVVTRSRRRLSRKPEVWRYEYDAEGRMVAARTAGQLWVYCYDPFGRRISKQRLDTSGEVAEQTVFTWDGLVLIEQSRSGAGGSLPTVTTWDHLPGGWTPVIQRTGRSAADAQFFAVVSDLMGTPTELVTADGTRVVWTNAGSSLWGAPREADRIGRADCPLRFPGQYVDDETGLHYNHHRYYDPSAARYTTPDPLGLAPADDPYAYVLNPTRWSDPLGLAPCDPAGLRGDELNGGHTIERHVGKSLNYLRERGIPEASTFPDLATASAETASNLTQNFGAVRFWLDQTRAQVVSILGEVSPGSGLTYLADLDLTVESSLITTVLRRRPEASGGFTIISSYPEP